MPALPVPVPTIGPLPASNVLMTFARYGHLRFKGVSLGLVVLVSWGIVFLEHGRQVPANRRGSAVHSAGQLKTIQEVLTLSVFAAFPVACLGEPFAWNYPIGFVSIGLGVFFIFHEWS